MCLPLRSARDAFTKQNPISSTLTRPTHSITLQGSIYFIVTPVHLSQANIAGRVTTHSLLSAHTSVFIHYPIELSLYTARSLSLSQPIHPKQLSHGRTSHLYQTQSVLLCNALMVGKTKKPIAHIHTLYRLAGRTPSPSLISKPASQGSTFMPTPSLSHDGPSSYCLFLAPGKPLRISKGIEVALRCLEGRGGKERGIFLRRKRQNRLSANSWPISIQRRHLTYIPPGAYSSGRIAGIIPMQKGVAHVHCCILRRPPTFLIARYFCVATSVVVSGSSTLSDAASTITASGRSLMASV